MSIQVLQYDSSMFQDWNEFLYRSKNAPFFFHRDFLEYHSDRFNDLSVVIYKDGKLVSLIPSNYRSDGIVISHEGLTFGGVVVDRFMGATLFLECFGAYLEFMRDKGFKSLIYKAIPSIYHQIPSSEELYAAFKFGGDLIRRDVGSVVKPRSCVPFSTLRNRMIKRFIKNDLVIREGGNYSFFWKILVDTLNHRHGVQPVHSLNEIEFLHKTFPRHIRLFEVFQAERLLAGVVIFESNTVAHAQYIAASAEGKDLGALDGLFSYLIKSVYVDKEWFSFGVSTEDDGRCLNEGLISQKEGFGARACVSDFYEFKLNH